MDREYPSILGVLAERAQEQEDARRARETRLDLMDTYGHIITQLTREQWEGIYPALPPEAQAVVAWPKFQEVYPEAPRLDPVDDHESTEEGELPF